MKKMKIVLFLIVFIFNSCGSKDQSIEVPYSPIRNSIKENFSQNIQDINNRIDERIDAIGKGFNSITGLTGERCLENEKTKFVFEPMAHVAYEENLNSEQILNKLGIGLNANIPIQASGIPISLSPEMRYSMESSSTSLSKTSNLTIEIIKGFNIISNEFSNLNFKLKSIHYKNLKENTSNFFNTCGDEIVVKQKLKAQLLITAKFIFSDSKTKSEFESAMGASMPIPFNIGHKKTSNQRNKVKNNIHSDLNENSSSSTIDILKEKLSPESSNSSSGMSPEIKVKYNKLKMNVLKNISISVKAIQIGGDASKVPVLLSSMCNLSDPGTCDTLFATIQNYASTEFPEQLKDALESNDEKGNKKFYMADIEKSLYSNFTIIAPNGNNISKEIINYTDNSIEFTNFKLNVRKDLRSSFQNYLKSHDIQNNPSFKSLADNEINVVKNTMDISENNLYSLFRFLNKCFLNIANCQSNYENKKNLFYSEYDKSFDDIKNWTFLTSTQVQWKTPGIFSDRISADFFQPSSLKGFSSFMVKYIDQNRNKITSESHKRIDLRLNFRCSTKLWDTFGNSWMENVIPNKVHPVTENIIGACKNGRIFATSQTESLAKIGSFYLEIWAE